ncbi:monooxygenase, partial [Aureobasidium melanogenum]
MSRLGVSASTSSTDEANPLIGDVLTIGTSAVRALKRWPDMAEENDRISYEMWISWHKINGELISGPAPFRPNVTQKNKKIERAGLTVEYDQHVIEYHEDESKAWVVMKNNTKIQADVVVAADGVGSKSHNIILGREVRARPAGVSMYRALLPIDQALREPAVDEKFPLLENGMSSTQLWMGEKVYAMFGRTKNDLIWYITYPNQGSSEESWSKMADPEVVLQTTTTIEGWPEFANRIIKLTKKEQIFDFKLVWREPQPCWVSPVGRVVQVGDAAHTFLPSSGNGATQGMEDAVSLATCLQVAGKKGVPWATRVHNKLRFERVACLQLLGVLNHELRNRSAEANASQTKPIGILGSWIWRHDPEEYAIQNYEKAKAHLTNGTEFVNTNIPPGHIYTPWTIDEILKAKEMGEQVVLGGDWDD